MTHYKVTFDTNVFVEHKFGKINLNDIYIAKFRDKFIQPYAVTTSEREDSKITKIEILRNGYGSRLYGVGLYGGNIVKYTHIIPELYTIGISPIGKAAIGTKQRKNNISDILSIICSNNSWKTWDFNNLDKEQLNKYNDSLIFECHSHLKHDVFVSNDKKSFIHRDGSARKKLEEKYKTIILTTEEFEDECELSSVTKKAP